MATSKTSSAEAKPAEKAKPKVAKAPAKASAPVAKPAAKKVSPKTGKAPGAVAARLTRVVAEPIGGKIKVTQVVGTIARERSQEATLVGLGLNKRHRSRVLEDTPAVRGMIYKVRHLVKVEKVS